MPERPGKCYRKKKGKTYTRISEKKPKKSYVKGVPVSRIERFETGDKARDFPVEVTLSVKRGCQIRDKALEAARTNTNKYLLKKLGEKNYFLKVLVYPHHVLRENPIATGAGADRYQDGMRMAFGKPIGKAARVDKNQKIIVAKVPEGMIDVAKEALNRANHKLPVPCKIENHN